MPFILKNQEEKVVIGLYYCKIIKSFVTSDVYEQFTEYHKSLYILI